MNRTYSKTIYSYLCVQLYVNIFQHDCKIRKSKNDLLKTGFPFPKTFTYENKIFHKEKHMFGFQANLGHTCCHYSVTTSFQFLLFCIIEMKQIFKKDVHVIFQRTFCLTFHYDVAISEKNSEITTPRF